MHAYLAMNIRTLIIDDDPFIKDLLKDKLDQFIPDVEVIDTAEDGAGGIIKIQKHSPDLVFLDVEMDDMTGFEMLSKLDVVDFEIVFITAYKHYAIKAIRFNALDYLVKPIDLGELRSAIRRYKNKLQKQVPGRSVQQALQNIRTKKAANKQLTLQTQEGELRMQLKDIIRIEGERNYSFIHLIKGKKKLVSKTLGEFEEILEDKGFFRNHKSHIVNFDHIISHNRQFVQLTDESELPIARRKKEEFREWFSQF